LRSVIVAGNIELLHSGVICTAAATYVVRGDAATTGAHTTTNDTNTTTTTSHDDGHRNDARVERAITESERERGSVVTAQQEQQANDAPFSQATPLNSLPPTFPLETSVAKLLLVLYPATRGSRATGFTERWSKDISCMWAWWWQVLVVCWMVVGRW